MKHVAILLLAVSIESVANGVGAFNPHELDAASTQFAVANVDNGASNRWTAHPTQYLSIAEETKQFEKRIEGFDARVNEELNALISEKIDSLIDAQK